MKFYEDETYIKMCGEAKDYLPDVVRLTIGYLELGVKYQDNNVFAFDGEKFVWLPRMEQLQEMLEKEYKPDESTFYEFVWGWQIHNLDYIMNVDKEETPIIVLLLCVMNVIYKKVWVPSRKEWVDL